MLSQLSHKDMDCETPRESHGKKRSNECSKEKVVDVQELVDELIVFEHLDYGKDTVFPTRPLKCHASTSSVQIPGAIEKTFCPTDLNYVMTKNQSVHVGSAIGSGYPVYGGRLSTSGTIFGSIQTEIPSIQSSSYSPSNDWLAQCPSACIEQRIPMECNTISQSKAYLMMHSSSAFCAPEHEACSETQAPNLCSGSDAVFNPSQCYPVASFSDLGISDTPLTKGFLNDIALASLLNVNLKDQSHLNRQEPTNDTSLGGASLLNANLKDQSHLNWQEHRNETSPVAGLLNDNLEEQSHLNWQEPRNESSPEAGFLNANLEEQSHLNWPLQEREPWTDGDKCFDQWFDPCHKPDFPGF